MGPSLQASTTGVGPGIDLAGFVNACLHGGCGSVSASNVGANLANIWVYIVVIGYTLSIISFFVIVYSIMRLFDLRKREAAFYGTIIGSADEQTAMHPRWAHIQSLAGGGVAQSREAIIEADIMLDEVLTNAGYSGETLAEKLQSADKLSFGTLQDAWEAHKVRNQIAHEGSNFKLSESLARRTLDRYEAVFREFKAI